MICPYYENLLNFSCLCPFLSLLSILSYPHIHLNMQPTRTFSPFIRLFGSPTLGSNVTIALYLPLPSCSNFKMISIINETSPLDIRSGSQSILFPGTRAVCAISVSLRTARLAICLLYKLHSFVVWIDLF